MAIQSVPSLMGITKAPYASFAGKSEAEVVTGKRRHFAAIMAARGMGGALSLSLILRIVLHVASG